MRVDEKGKGKRVESQSRGGWQKTMLDDEVCPLWNSHLSVDDWTISVEEIPEFIKLFPKQQTDGKRMTAEVNYQHRSARRAKARHFHESLEFSPSFLGIQCKGFRRAFLPKHLEWQPRCSFE